MLHAHCSEKSGFTLIELSIVLVIIGLVAGGVLVGVDLIKAAKLRADISQLESYRTAMNTFKLKYGGVAGDMNGVKAVQLGLLVNWYPENANDDGKLECYTYAGGTITLANDANSAGYPYATGCTEPAWFWEMLSKAKLVSGQYELVSGGGDITKIAPWLKACQTIT